VAFSPDGKSLAAACARGKLLLWDAPFKNPHRVLTGVHHELYWVTFSPDGGRLAYAGDDTFVRIWDVARGECTSILRGHQANVYRLSFSADGRRLVSGDGKSRLILWDTESGKELKRWEMPGTVFGAVFSPDGRHVVTAQINGNLYVLRLPPALLTPAR